MKWFVSTVYEDQHIPQPVHVNLKNESICKNQSITDVMHHYSYCWHELIYFWLPIQ